MEKWIGKDGIAIFVVKIAYAPKVARRNACNLHWLTFLALFGSPHQRGLPSNLLEGFCKILSFGSQHSRHSNLERSFRLSCKPQKVVYCRLDEKHCLQQYENLLRWCLTTCVGTCKYPRSQKKDVASSHQCQEQKCLLQKFACCKFLVLACFENELDQLSSILTIHQSQLVYPSKEFGQCQCHSFYWWEVTSAHIIAPKRPH